MKKVKVAYSVRNNLGDSINPLIIENILGYQVECADEYNCDTSGIGSGLRRFFIPKKKLYKSPNSIKRYTKGRFYKDPVQIWSAGFTYYPPSVEVPVRPNINIASVRGELTKKRMETIFNRKLDITTGDAGLLSSELIKKPLKKKYTLGIIPHDSERNEKAYKEINKNNKNSILIDVQADPIETIQKMSECDAIITSSLHGLIIADSLGVPNRQVILTNNLSGDGYKFDDYYSSFKLLSKPINLNNSININIEDLINNYRITETMVYNKKQEITKAFSMYI